MVEFGVYPKFESTVYTISVPPHAVPLSIHISVPASGARDFVLVPDGVTAQMFPDAFAGYARSDALGSIFRYVGADRSEILLANDQWIASPRRTDIRFALARWLRTSTVPFPETVHCIQRVSIGAEGLTLHEIVASNSRAIAEGASK